MTVTTDDRSDFIQNLGVIDVDSHLAEATDLWTSRVSSKWGDSVPHVAWDDKKQRECWIVSGYSLSGTAQHAVAGWPDPFPAEPTRLADADPASWKAKDRLERMTEYGIQSQIMYPNIIGFYGQAFMEMEPELALDCVRAYNDYQTEFCEADPQRLIAITVLPFWDLEASKVEMTRCAELGHRGINFAWQFENIGLPELRSGHWNPLLAHAQDLDTSVNFHVGFGSFKAEAKRKSYDITPIDMAKFSALNFMGNAGCIAELIVSGICEQFPRIRFVSVESGYGWVPFVLDALDWQFANSEARTQHADWLLPSEYFRRQIYATFWFEKNADRMLDLYPDNVMFESDFPHATSLSPGGGTNALNARDTIQANLAAVPDDLLRKVLHGTAARVYKL